MFRCLIVLFLLFPAAAHAQGLYIENPSHSKWVIHTDRKVHAEIKDAGVCVSVTDTFHNRSNAVLEGSYVFPLPKDAAATGLSMFINGQEMKGEVLTADKARGIYDEIVSKAKDPGLLEYIGNGLLRASIYPINPRKDVTVRLQYVSAVQRTGRLSRFNFPLKSSANGDPKTLVSVNLDSSLPIRNIYSPSHSIDVTRNDDYRARAVFEGMNPDKKNFCLFYTLSNEKFGFTLMTHKESEKDRFFMLMISPLLKVDKEKVLPKDVVFILDKSGSMQGEKWKQAVNALKFCINGLDKKDRFAFLSFSTEANAFKESLSPASPEEKTAAIQHLDSLSPAGGTNIQEALTKGLKIASSSDRLCMLGFLTDGLPTVGETDLNKIVKNVKASNKKNLRIFNFGVGYDVNTYLLDSISELASGQTTYIEPKENIEIKVSDFFSQIKDPMLMDVNLAFEGVEPFDLYPKKMGDVFAGSSLVAVGKLPEFKKGKVILTGLVNGEKQTFSFEGDFSDKNKGFDFLPKYWALRKTGYLLNEIRLNGVNKELKDEVTALGKKYGLVTPYTSALVVEEGAMAPRAVTRRQPTSHGGSYRGPGDSTPPGVSGSTGFMVGRGRKKMSAPATPGPAGPVAVKKAKALNKMAKKGRTSDPLTMKTIGKLRFHKKGDLYVDSRFKDEMKKDLIKVIAFSPAYFKLLKNNPELKDVFALGERIIFLFQGKAYEIQPEKE